MQNELARELGRFTTKQRRVIYENVFAIELTEGCSVGCDFCGFDAQFGVKSSVPFNDLENIAGGMAELTDRTTNPLNRFSGYINKPNRLFLYDATDPLDYRDNWKNYFDARELFTTRGFKITTSTAIPKGKEELAVAHLAQIDRISISHMNRARLLPNFPRLGVAVYIDLFNYYRSKFGKRVFDDSPIREGQILVTGTVEKAVEKLRKQDPTLPTKTRFYDLRKDRNKRHEEVQDPNTLILWCGREKHPPRDGRILDRDEDGTFSAGRAFDIPSRIVEHWQTHYRKTFCSISGIKLTPKGVFNVMPVECSEECRTGRIVEKVTPDDFKVVKLEKIDNPLLSLDISPWQYLLLE